MIVYCSIQMKDSDITKLEITGIVIILQMALKFVKSFAFLNTSDLTFEVVSVCMVLMTKIYVKPFNFRLW